VEHTLASLLSAEVSDSRLSQLIILGVEPAGGRFQILCGAPEVQKAVEALERARGFLKTEVAHTLNRKHAVELEFIVVPC